MQPKDRLLRIDEVVELVALSRVTIFRMRREGRFPEPLQIGPRAIRWKLSDIEGWMQACGSAKTTPPANAA